MKIIIFKGGLGNTIFEYAHLKKLKRLYPEEEFYCCRFGFALAAHNGFELDKRFCVELPKESKFINVFVYVIHRFNNYLRRKFAKAYFVNDNLYNYDDSKSIVDGYFQDSSCFDSDFILDFKLPNEWDNRNSKLKEDIENSESIAVHVRRTDYLKYPDLYRVLDMDYYRSAFEKTQEKFPNAKYFVFSDDIEWCKENFKEYDCTFVNWNIGPDSYLDMYFMTLCRGVIMANSTFSFWGAQLNKHRELIIQPQRWRNDGRLVHLSIQGCFYL